MIRCLIFMCIVLLLTVSCGDDDGPGTEADRVGVGAACSTDDDCPQPVDTNAPAQVCLQQFDGGYCGIENCVDNTDCPDGAACVAHTDGVNYCFRICTDKSECNLNRPADAQSNCSANIEFTDSSTNAKACVPPSS